MFPDRNQRPAFRRCLKARAGRAERPGARRTGTRGAVQGQHRLEVAHGFQSSRQRGSGDINANNFMQLLSAAC